MVDYSKLHRCLGVSSGATDARRRLRLLHFSYVQEPGDPKVDGDEKQRRGTVGRW